MHSKKRVLLSVLIFLAVFLVGIVGFRHFGGTGWSFLDSMYMTVITMSTVGYEEVLDISANPGARVFAMVFILLCLGTVAFGISSITAFIVEGELKNILWKNKMEKAINKLRDHFIVCGADETAQTIIQELRLIKKPFVVIEPDRDKIEKLLSQGELLYIQGDPSEDETLTRANIRSARGIILSLPSDQENLYVTLTAREMNPAVRIVTKGLEDRSARKMTKAGADAVVSPPFIGGMRMVSEMVRPAVVTFLDMMLRDREKALRFEELPIVEGSAYAGQTIARCRMDHKKDTLIVAVREAGSENYIFPPPDDRVIEPGDILVLIGNADTLQKMEHRSG
ncbi:MAG: potassium channel protein [Candidatus Aminicenantes bacterium]|nr:potassium channel protein [Acidobacteriota bacterium]MCG2814892.1 potassium channel protein [Candidatus Aminicenantes bacterium]